MRKKKAFINTAFSIMLEVVTILAGFILPRLFIGTFGSEVNGLVSSISNFIGYITLLQSGVGTVAKAAMYGPLAKKDHEKLCIIVKTVEAFFRKIALITVAYVFILMFLFPTVISPESGSFFYTASLVAILGISTAAQYFFGITHQMLLEADQKSYIYSIIQIATVIINTLVSIILIKTGCSVQTVKLGSASVFVLKPVLLSVYTNRSYHLSRAYKADNSLIKQRWDGLAQAIAYFIHSKTDVFVLTIFARISSNVTLSLVSVYGVYQMVTTGLTSFIRAIEKAVTSALGNIVALEENDHLINTFNLYYNFTHVLCTIVFSTASITIFKFISIYVKNVTDAEYIQYTFGYIIIAAEYLYCLRLPYNSIINAAGKFKETRTSAIIEAVVNICISIVFVSKLGLTGVAIGTFTAMAYRTVSFIIFFHNNVIQIKIGTQIKRYAVSFAIYGLLLFAASLIDVSIDSFFSWFVYAGIVFAVTGIVTLVSNMILLRKETLSVIQVLLKKR